jgi:hypothetical protein
MDLEQEEASVEPITTANLDVSPTTGVKYANDGAIDHIKKTLSVNLGKDYHHYGMSLFEMIDGNPEITVQVDDGDEIRIWSTGHFVVELVKRGSTIWEDKTYTFGFGYAANKLSLAATGAGFATQYLYRQMHPLLLGTAITYGVMNPNQGVFFSPDAVLERNIKGFSNNRYVPTKDANVKLLGLSLIDETPDAQKLKLALNSLFAYINQSKTSTKNGELKSGGIYVNAVLPDWYSSVPTCVSNNCASFFEHFLTTDLLQKSTLNFYSGPNGMLFKDTLKCLDCNQRDKEYVSQHATVPEGPGWMRAAYDRGRQMLSGSSARGGTSRKKRQQRKKYSRAKRQM